MSPNQRFNISFGQEYHREKRRRKKEGVHLTLNPFARVKVPPSGFVITTSR